MALDLHRAGTSVPTKAGWEELPLAIMVSVVWRFPEKHRELQEMLRFLMLLS